MEPVPPDQRGLVANLLWMLFHAAPTEQAIRAMDISLILYAEHDFNASTFTARVVASTLSDLHSAVTAGIAALKGPLHGGANERAMEVVREIGTADKAEAWTRDALARKVRIMGFGHRVYKHGDPRAILLKPICAELAAATGHGDMERLADIVEQIVVAEKHLPPNLDWPSAETLLLSRLADRHLHAAVRRQPRDGLERHVIEQLDNNRLIRPLARYTGPAPRPWVPLECAAGSLLLGSTGKPRLPQKCATGKQRLPVGMATRLSPARADFAFPATPYFGTGWPRLPVANDRLRTIFTAAIVGKFPPYGRLSPTLKFPSRARR